MKCFNLLLSNKVQLTVFMLILICVPFLCSKSKIPNESEIKKLLKESLKKNQEQSEYFEEHPLVSIQEFKNVTEVKNEQKEIKKEAEIININIPLEKITKEPEIKNENNLQKLITYKRNYSILIALVGICGGFILAATFLLFALAYNKQTLGEISSASLQIVKSLKEVSTTKVTGGDILTMHI
jgi:hypothetical protein